MSVDEAAPTGDETGEALGPDLALTTAFVRAVLDALEKGDRAGLKALLEPLHPADLADLIGLLRAGDRRALVEALGAELNADVLSELDEGVRDELLPLLAPEVVAEAIGELDSDDAVYLIEELDPARQEAILEHVDEADRTAVELGLLFPEDSAGRLMQREIITVPPFWTVGQVIDHMRSAENLPEQFFEIYVVNPSFEVEGVVPTARLMRSQRPVRVEDIMDADFVQIPAATDQEEAAYYFDQYHLISAPVVDDAGRLVGMITVDDIVRVIQAEHAEDILGLAGVAGEEELSASVITTTRRRFSWLFINLITAILASVVIGFFDATIEQYVALAVLMPIVASMGGNAGTQTLTVAVRAMATKDLTPANAARIVMRESLVGGLNGVLFAVLIGAVAGAWFQDAALGGVIAAAMIVNLLVAGTAGIAIPLGLQRLGADPALASAVFLTTVTDIVGFLAFLGLASLVLLG